MTFGFAERIGRLLLVGSTLALVPVASAAASTLEFTDDEMAHIASLGPWPPDWSGDPGNRVSGNPAAIRLGQRLFFEQRLSANGKVSCATCHMPARGFQDGRNAARGLAQGTRNTPGLLNVRHQRWFGWDGGHDNLWSASLRAIQDPGEMGGDARRTARTLLARADLACYYQAAFGKPARASDPDLMVNVAKAIAAWQETLVSPPTPFDAFRNALARGDAATAEPYPAAARRGLRLFLGRGQCATCHAGPMFSNGEFGDIGVPFFLKPSGVDPGRQGGIKRLQANPNNLLGAHNDDASRANATATLHVRPEHRNFGEFKVPTLRNLTLTAPYMHNGSLTSLREVVKHYSELDEERLHSDGERILRPLKLSTAEVGDLVAFLKSLSPAILPDLPDYRVAVPACRHRGR
jgi:cytochrome c peroxidase